ncbi:glycosyltransferase [Pseudoroseomonas globiformis]|uniref:Glycosyltransferase n=1 Tax=Teichococcus globiformis TaxID=2307229 RepID=A0ABV7FX45_9PROT
MPPSPIYLLRGWLRSHPTLHRQLRDGTLWAARRLPALQHALTLVRDPRIAIGAGAYASWVQQWDTPTEAQRQAILQGIGAMPRRPLISVVMPAYNTPEASLRQAIASVRTQLYPDWELCIADDASPAPHVEAVLKEEAARDPRIRYVRRERNGHISAASNTALEMARGEYVALMDHDDLLPPHALAAVVYTILREPDLQVVFSDEDKVDDHGQRSDPHFKPGWNPELLLGQNLVSHLGVYRRDLLERIGGFREGLEGSQDWDLALRATQGLPQHAVRHIPMVLYHWRQNGGTASFSETALERCARAGRRAVSEHLDLQGGAGARVEAQASLPGWMDIAHALPSQPPSLSIVLTRPGAPEREEWMLPAGMKAEVLEPTDAEPPLATAARATGDLVLFLDPALRPDEPDWLLAMLAQAMRPGIGAVGPLVQDARDYVAEAGLLVDSLTQTGHPVPYLHGMSSRDAGYFGHLRLARQVSAVSGMALAVRRDALAKAELSAGRQEDWAVALCLALGREGLGTIWTPAARLRHPAPTRRPPAPDGLTDPFFNPNLAVSGPGLRLTDGPGGAGMLVQAMREGGVV